VINKEEFFRELYDKNIEFRLRKLRKRK